MKRKTTKRRNKSQEAAAGTSAFYPRSHPTHPSDALPALLRLNDMDGNPSSIPATCMWARVVPGERGTKQVPTDIKEYRALQDYCVLGSFSLSGLVVCCGRGCELPDWGMGPAEVATITLLSWWLCEVVIVNVI